MQCIVVQVLISSIFCVQKIKGDFDPNVCNPSDLKPVTRPPPSIPLSYSTKLEWKWVDKNETISITEVHDGINNIGSQTIYMLGQTTQIIYDYVEHQYIVYNPNTGCNATGLGTLAYYDNKIWLTATNMIYHVAREGTAPYIGETVVRNLSVDHWKSCLLFYQFNITVEIDMYFSVMGWGMAISTPDQIVPVRFEMKGSYDYRNGSDTPATYFHVIGDFVDFNPKPPINLDPLQPPPGIFCQGRKSRKPMNPLPTSFSLVMENIDLNYFQITYQSVWFHAEKNLVRRDAKEARGSDPDPTIDILDYNLGIHYSMDSYTSSCNPSEITVQDLYAKAHGDNTVVMQSALDFFHVLNTNIQYVGTRTARGVACDVWVGVYLDAASARNDTVEWYFTKFYVPFNNISVIQGRVGREKRRGAVEDVDSSIYEAGPGTTILKVHLISMRTANWVEAVDLAIQPAALIRIDMWKGGSNKPVVHNIYHFDPVAPSLDVFSVAPCYQSSMKRRILIPFKALNGARIDKVSTSYLKGILHDVITARTFIDPLRLTDMEVTPEPHHAKTCLQGSFDQIEFQGSSKVYMAATLLDRPTLTSRYLFPMPSPPTNLHDLAETYFFLNGLVNQPLTLKINTTVGTEAITIQATGLFNIDYPLDASSTTSTTTLSTTEATPPPPTKAPTTTKQKVPVLTPGKAQLKSSRTPTTTTTTTTATTTTTTPSTTKTTKATTLPPKTTRTSIFASSTTLLTRSSCTCPKVTCPPVSQPKTPKSPTPPPSTPCPTTTTSTTPAKTTTTNIATTATTSVPTKQSALTKPTSTSSPAKISTVPLTTLSPLSTKSTTTSSKSGSTLSDNATNKNLRQTSNKNQSDKGMSGGVVAGISIVMLVVGLVCGIIALRFYQVFRRSRDPEGKNILSRYLDDDLKY